MIVELESKTHPKAEILSIDLKRNEFTFRWVDGPYGGECSTPIKAETIEEIAMLVAPKVLPILNTVVKDADAA